MTQLLAASEHVLLRFVKTAIHALPFDHVARAAACDKIAGILLALACPWNHKIHGQGESILEAGQSVQSAVLAAVLVALEDVQSFASSHWSIQEPKGHKIKRHGAPPEPQICWNAAGVRLFGS